MAVSAGNVIDDGDFKPLYKVISASASVSVAASSSALIPLSSYNISVPTGYSMAALVYITSGATGVCIRGFDLTGKSATGLYLYNTTSSAKSGTSSIQVLCLKTALKGQTTSTMDTTRTAGTVIHAADVNNLWFLKDVSVTSSISSYGAITASINSPATGYTPVGLARAYSGFAHGVLHSLTPTSIGIKSLQSSSVSVTYDTAVLFVRSDYYG